MKKCNDKSGNLPRDSFSDGYWEKLVERYFEADTTEEEEQALRRFLATEEAAARPEFDEARAVMGFLAVGQRLAASAAPAPEAGKGKRRPLLRLPLARVAVAASVLIAAGSLLWLHRPQSESLPPADACIAYIGGKPTTDPAAVKEQMRLSLGEMAAPTGVPTVEEQLQDMFNTLEE